MQHASNRSSSWASSRKNTIQIQVAHFLFFGAYFVLNNPFFTQAATVKFLTFLAMIGAGATIAWRLGNKPLGGKLLIAIGFLLFYGIAAIRLNEVQAERFGDTITTAYQQAALSLITFLASIIFSKALDAKMTAVALFWSALPCGIWICLNFAALSDYELRNDFQIGNLQYDSYQVSSTILAVGALSALGLIDIRRLLNGWNFLYAAVFLYFGFFVFQGLGRGEAIGFAVASLMLMAPRLTLLAAPFSYAIFSFLVLTMESPLTIRLRIFLEGNFGSRDELFHRVFDMLGEEPSLLLMGGGLSYFQKFYSLTSGYYPHNIFLEGLVSGGIGLMMVLLGCFLYPVLLAYWKALTGRLDQSHSFIFALTILMAIIALKSGSILTFWGLATFACVFLQLLDSVREPAELIHQMRGPLRPPARPPRHVPTQRFHDQARF